MKIGILGAGMIGGTLGPLWHAAGHEVFFGTRHPGRSRDLVARLGHGAHAGTAEEAATFGEVVLLAVPLAAVPELGRTMAGAVAGKVVLDATNPYAGRDGELANEAQATPGGSSRWVAQHLSGARVVKAFNTVYFQTLEREAHQGEDRVGIPIAGDDAGALDVAARLVRDAGFEPVVAGGLDRGRDFEPGTKVYNTGMRASALRAALRGGGAP